MKFNLITEPWLPAIDLKGTRVLLGLLQLLARAHELKALVLETPDITAGVYRLLLAILHRAYDGPKDLSKEWRAIWDAKRFDEKKVAAYLEEWSDRFDLWDARHPFLQDPALPLDEPESVSRLFVEHAQGNNPTLFDHTLDDDAPSVDAAVAARRLVGSQVMALGGRIPGSATSAVAGPFATSVTFLVLGDTLFETLALNLLVYDRARLPIPSNAKDAPSWERDIAKAGPRAPDGHLDLLTWRPRRLRLVPAEDGRRVTGVVPGGEADRLESDDLRDPLAGYRVSESAGYLPLRVDPDRALWRDSLPFFAGDGVWGRLPLNVSQVASLVATGVVARSQLLRVSAAGFATDKAKKRLGRVETIPIPAALLAEKSVVPIIQRAIERATEVDQSVNSAAFVAARHSLSSGERSPDTGEIRGLADSTGARTVYWAGAGAAFPALLLDLAQRRPDAEERWEQSLVRSARRGFETVEVKLGGGSRSFKALTLGRQTLNRRLAEVFPPTDAQEPAHP